MAASRRRIFTNILVTAGLALAACTPIQSASTIEDAARISLERGPCFGTCPIYKVEIHGDGTVIYTGERFVKVTGEQRAQISPVAVAGLVDQFVMFGFFDLKDEYIAEVTDLPTYTLSVSLSGRQKTVTDYGGKMANMPPIVTVLENEVDRVAGTQQWIKSDGELFD
jgi:hypothetical protein